MFGLPQPEPTEEERKAQEEQSFLVVRNAACAAALLWFSPVVWNFVKRQWK
ncbi:hypothetical protein TBLA_0C05370 [Henningerozyma blattae CBS 6284]|uniref:Mitochondrial import receptor subunit TOM5 n=1 Tax=Henningerozyma blattae (strain ATCC 34711 / CBS 6284 / DSM 70876 / NBRC 10599 / NRRL Y-10934 / UCD 77-7) TaxID=1071380 RepID=I2H1T2_HENB6|nr:hypothetical protein TBLA_0C05370 [Tetrapisispora blattae CBS 6284]CCH60334.1 hypothetical protein TBLA_0C05370 [Tetrapisispora blattae CBS 6284]